MVGPKQRLINPNTMTEVFANVPDVISKKYRFPAGPVFLFYGRRNFGATHVWDRHKSEMHSKGFDCFEKVPDFVASILRPCAPLHLEGGSSVEKLAVIQSKSGTAIIQLFEPVGSECYYSVVTAFLGFNRHGPRISSLV